MDFHPFSVHLFTLILLDRCTECLFYGHFISQANRAFYWIAGYFLDPVGLYQGLLIASVGQHAGGNSADLLPLEGVIALEGAVGITD